LKDVENTQLFSVEPKRPYQRRNGSNPPGNPAWVKGMESPNPGGSSKDGAIRGRPPANPRTMVAALSKRADPDRIAKILLRRAYRGDMRALEYVYDRIAGKPVQAIDAAVSEKREYVLSLGAEVLPQPERVAQVEGVYRELREQRALPMPSGVTEANSTPAVAETGTQSLEGVSAVVEAKEPENPWGIPGWDGKGPDGEPYQLTVRREVGKVHMSWERFEAYNKTPRRMIRGSGGI
jgi:hypothetical protein